jgi:hypothetical protein
MRVPPVPRTWGPGIPPENRENRGLENRGRKPENRDQTGRSPSPHPGRFHLARFSSGTLQGIRAPVRTLYSGAFLMYLSSGAESPVFEKLGNALFRSENHGKPHPVMTCQPSIQKYLPPPPPKNRPIRGRHSAQPPCNQSFATSDGLSNGKQHPNSSAFFGPFSALLNQITAQNAGLQNPTLVGKRERIGETQIRLGSYLNVE